MRHNMLMRWCCAKRSMLICVYMHAYMCYVPLLSCSCVQLKIVCIVVAKPQMCMCVHKCRCKLIVQTRACTSIYKPYLPTLHSCSDKIKVFKCWNAGRKKTLLLKLLQSSLRLLPSVMFYVWVHNFCTVKPQYNDT